VTPLPSPSVFAPPAGLLTGADAASFKVIGTELFLKSSTAHEFMT